MQISPFAVTWRAVFAGLAVLTCLLLTPTVARADSGSITNIRAVGNGQIEATFSATSTGCTSYGYCGWFPAAWQVAATSPCSAESDDIIYVGDLQDSTGTQTATAAFYKNFEPVKLCLFIYRDGLYRLVAETVYASPPPPPPPAPVGPTLVAPAPDASSTAGESVRFRVHSPEAFDLVTVEVSRSNAVDPDGTLADSEVMQSEIADDNGAGEHYVRMAGRWTRRPGIYFWQAHRIDCNADASDCYAESEIRRLQIVEPALSFAVFARRRQQLKSPRRSKFNNLVLRLRCNRSCRVRLRGTPFFRASGRRRVLRGFRLSRDFRLGGRDAVAYGFHFTRSERSRLTSVMRRYRSLLWRIELRATSPDGDAQRATRFIRMVPPPLLRPAPNPRARRPSCDPSYPTVCIRPPPPDLDCDEIPYHDFRVIGRDPHGFDGEGDGLGCES